MYTDNRDTYRQIFFVAWQKYQKKLALEPVEMQLIEIILLHPEYHPLLEKPDAYQKQEFALEENPFFHMSLHSALREQIRLNRPAGIALIYQQLIVNDEDHHAVEHRMMECLAQLLWKAQQQDEAPSEEEYLAELKKI